jgi:sulfide:quinone oxidoreductase
VSEHVVIAGGGVAGLELALALRALAEERVSVEVVAPEKEFTYRPLAVVEPFRAGEVASFPLRALVRAAGA